MIEHSRPTYAEIDLDAVRHNIRAIREKVGPNVRIMPAVKADAYGHGAVEVSRAVIEAGADSLGIACVEEGIELREAGIAAPALILGCSTADAASDIIRYDLTAAVCDLNFAKKLAKEAQKQGKTVPVHLKVDTGMGRIGASPEEAIALAKGLSCLDGICIEGLFTHFPTSDCFDREFTKQQIASFNRLIADLKRDGISVPLCHASNSGAIIDHPDSYLDMVRPGIIVYGLYPSSECSRILNLLPALSLKTAIVYLKEIEPGATVSYGRTYKAGRRTKVATLPIGYADGYNRQLSNCGKAVVNGIMVPVIGRVCMDQIMIDVTDVPDVKLGGEVSLYGSSVNESICVEEIAKTLNTIPYEVTCWISKRVPRIYRR